MTMFVYFQDLVFSASPDATIRVWGVQQAQCGQIVRTHEGPVTGLSLHATGDYLLSSSTDGVRATFTNLTANPSKTLKPIARAIVPT